MQVRRVVTGHDANGKAVVASDSEVDGYRPSLTPGSEFHFLLGADEAPHFPDDGSEPKHHPYFPAAGGFRFGFFAVPPGHRVDTEPPADVDAALADFEEHMPGLRDHMEPDAPGMHTTDTIDFEYIISGELVLELDDGAEVVLGPGDTVVQNGTRHRWHNRSTEPAVYVAFLIGAHRK